MKKKCKFNYSSQVLLSWLLLFVIIRTPHPIIISYFIFYIGVILYYNLYSIYCSECFLVIYI